MQQLNGFRTRKSFEIHDVNKNASTLSQPRNEAQVHRPLIIVVMSTVSVAIVAASHICNDPATD